MKQNSERDFKKKNPVYLFYIYYICLYLYKLYIKYILTKC